MMNTSMRNYSSYNQVQGITTSASRIYGGVTSGQTYARIGSIRRGGQPGIPEDPWWSCGCVDEDGDEICDICGCDLRLVDENGICGCIDESGYCWCPVECDWKAILFLSALAGLYTLHKVRSSKKEQLKRSVAAA